jgi:hypothetical protein
VRFCAVRHRQSGGHHVGFFALARPPAGVSEHRLSLGKFPSGLFFCASAADSKLTGTWFSTERAAAVLFETQGLAGNVIAKPMNLLTDYMRHTDEPGLRRVSGFFRYVRRRLAVNSAPGPS